MHPQTMPSSQDSHSVTASDPPAGSISPASPRPDSTHRVVDVDLSKVRDSKGRLIPGLRYRIRHRTQFTGTRISWIFDHGADCESNGGVRWFVCRQCQLDRRHGDGVYKLTGIHAVEAHLEQAHKIFNPRKPKKPELPPIQDFFQRRSSTPSSSSSYSLVTPFHDLRFKQAFTDAVIKLDLSFRQASSGELRDVILMGGPAAERAIPKSPIGVASWVKWSFEDRRQQLKELVSKTGSKINFSVDLWTSDEGNKRAYLAVNSHFIDHCGSLRTALLSFTRIIGPYSGENLAKAVYSSIRTYDIDYTRIGCFVADNASNNEEMLRELQLLIPIDYPLCRIRYIGHIINLVVEAILFGKGVSKFKQSLVGRTEDSEEAFEMWSKEGPIGKLYNICVFINRSDQRRVAFGNCQLLEERALDEDTDPDGGDEVFYYVLIVDQGVR